MEEVNPNLPPKNQRSKVPTRAPHQKLSKFSFPLRKKAIFFQTLRKYLKDQRRRRSDPLRNDVPQGPPQKISSIGGGDIKWNGPHDQKYKMDKKPVGKEPKFHLDRLFRENKNLSAHKHLVS